jgi:hypothetical protein
VASGNDRIGVRRALSLVYAMRDFDASGCGLRHACLIAAVRVFRDMPNLFTI